MKYIMPLLITLILPLAAADRIDPGTLQVSLSTPKAQTQLPLGNYLGTYTYPPSSRFTVSANTEGFVTRIAVKPFAHVKKGQTLFTLKSPKLLDMQSEYIATLLELEYYDKEVKRLEPLASKGVVASKQLTESRNRRQKLDASAAFQRDVLLAYGLKPSQLTQIASQHKPDPVLTITAPAAGSIATVETQTGGYVAEGAVLAQLIDTTECHFEIDMPWETADTLALGEKLTAGAQAFTVFAKAPQIDPVSQTRTIDLHEGGECGERGGASMNIALSRTAKAWKVPAASVTELDGRSVVFAQRSDGFEPLAVTVLSRREGFCYVTGALNADDRVAASSVLALRSAAAGGE
ncbi:efflux RND transporter periplasmic adaptor subunit [Sulfurimonas sp. HSL1-2]|uniref:efflux RND transporter periplasmic adaptor subunit n=1 Tax=Thiomicrolovo zhangzhouensis TaxID=3131933 RepID=UPI0031F7DD32